MIKTLGSQPQQKVCILAVLLSGLCLANPDTNETSIYNLEPSQLDSLPYVQLQQGIKAITERIANQKEDQEHLENLIEQLCKQKKELDVRCPARTAITDDSAFSLCPSEESTRNRQIEIQASATAGKQFVLTVNDTYISTPFSAKTRSITFERFDGKALRPIRFIDAVSLKVIAVSDDYRHTPDGVITGLESAPPDLALKLSISGRPLLLGRSAVVPLVAAKSSAVQSTLLVDPSEFERIANDTRCFLSREQLAKLQQDNR